MGLANHFAEVESRSTFLAGCKWAASSLLTDQRRPRVTRSRYRASATVSLLWPRVVPNTLVLPLYKLVQVTMVSAIDSLPLLFLTVCLPRVRGCAVSRSLPVTLL